MFRQRECMGHVVGSAAIGVAVGMLIHKMLSPSSSPTPKTKKDPAGSIRCEYVQEHSRSNNLQVPSHCHKHRKHRRNSRSKSASRSKHVREESGYLSVSPYSLRKSKLSASESDLRTTSETDGELSSGKCEKLKPTKNPENVTGDGFDKWRDASEFFLNTYKEYSPAKLRDSRNSTYTVEMDRDLDSFRESFTRESTEYLPLTSRDRREFCGSSKAFCDYSLNSFRGSFAAESTDYLPFKRQMNSEPGSLLFDINNRKSRTKDRNVTFWIGGLEDEEISNCSIAATCDTLDKSDDFDSYREGHPDIEGASK